MKPSVGLYLLLANVHVYFWHSNAFA